MTEDLQTTWKGPKKMFTRTAAASACEGCDYSQYLETPYCSIYEATTRTKLYPEFASLVA